MLRSHNPLHKTPVNPNNSIIHDAVTTSNATIRACINIIGTKRAANENIICVFVLRPLFLVIFWFRFSVVLLYMANWNKNGKIQPIEKNAHEMVSISRILP